MQVKMKTGEERRRERWTDRWRRGKTRRHGWMNEGLVSEAGREGERWTEIRGGECAWKGGERIGEKGGRQPWRLTRRGGEKSKENTKTKAWDCRRRHVCTAPLWFQTYVWCFLSATREAPVGLSPALLWFQWPGSLSLPDSHVANTSYHNTRI